MATVLIHFYLQHLKFYCLFLGNENIIKLGTGYFLKIAKIFYSQRENQCILGAKISFH